MKASLRGYGASLISQEFMPTGLRVALVIGSILFAINHGSALFSGQMSRDRWISGLLTYCVPYFVSVHGQYTSKVRQKPRRADAAEP